MRVLILNWRDIKNPDSGGAERYFHEVAKRLVKRGHKVDWISAGWKYSKRQIELDGINIVRCGNRFSVYILVPLYYLKLKERPDVVIDSENGFPFFSPLFSKAKNVLHIHHVHTDIWKKMFKEGKIKEKVLSGVGRFLESFLMPIVYKNSLWITVSKGSKEEIIAKKLYVGNIKIINPGIDIKNFNKFGKFNEPTILFLNRITPNKGLKTFLDSIPIIKKEIKCLKAIVAGTGLELDKMKDYALQNKIDVSFLGKVTEEEKKRLLQQTWLFVNPSMKEGWGIVNIEASYFGCPVVGSNIGGIRDSIINNKTGILFEVGNPIDLANKILNLMRNKKKITNMQKESKKWASRFSWDLKAEEYIKVLENYVKNE